MRPIVKKALAAVAIKQGIDKIRESRKPKRSAWSRMTPVLVVAGAVGTVALLAKTGKLQPALDKAKSMTGDARSQEPEPSAPQGQPVNA